MGGKLYRKKINLFESFFNLMAHKKVYIGDHFVFFAHLKE